MASAATSLAPLPCLPHIPIDIFAHLSSVLAGARELDTLTTLCRASRDVHDASMPALYRSITLTKDTTLPFFASHAASASYDLPAEKSLWDYTTHLQIHSLPSDLPELPLPPTPSTDRLFPNVRSITIDSYATWQLIVHSHAHHTTPHPLISFLTAHTSPSHLTVHYPAAERTAHSYGGGYCCCFAAVRAFQQNPLRAAAFDRSSTARFITSLAGGWELDRLSLTGVVDDQLPRDVGAKKLEVEWEACQCADEQFHGEWCFNHVSPLKRVEQVREVLAWGVDKGAEVSMSGVERVGGWSDVEDVAKWIGDRLAEDHKAEACCSAK